MAGLFMVHPEIGDALAEFTAASASPHGGILRAATAADTDGLAALLSAAYEEAWDPGRVRGVLLDAPDVGTTYVIELDGVVVATASTRYLDEYAGFGYVHYVAADAAWSGRGLGLAMTVAVLQEFQHHGLSRAVLETDVHRVPAVITYLRLGFVPEYRSEAERVAWSGLMRTLFRKGDVR